MFSIALKVFPVSIYYPIGLEPIKALWAVYPYQGKYSTIKVDPGLVTKGAAEIIPIMPFCWMKISQLPPAGTSINGSAAAKGAPTVGSPNFTQMDFLPLLVMSPPLRSGLAGRKVAVTDAGMVVDALWVLVGSWAGMEIETLIIDLS
jgi:hypothetical protein